MTALEIPQFELHSPKELAEILMQTQNWKEIEALTSAYPQWKGDAWKLLPESEQERIKKQKKVSTYAVAKEFPLGCTVQRLDDTEEQVGEVTDYWCAYGVEYVTFLVGSDTDWCRGDYLKRIHN